MRLEVLLKLDRDKLSMLLADYLTRVPKDDRKLGPIGAACLVMRQVWLTEQVKTPLHAWPPDATHFISWPDEIVEQLRRLAQEAEPTGRYALRALGTTYDEDAAREMVDLVVTREGGIQQEALLNLGRYRLAGVLAGTVRVNFIEAVLKIATRKVPTNRSYLYAAQIALDEGSIEALVAACDELPKQMGPQSAKVTLQPFVEGPLPDESLGEWCRQQRWTYDAEKHKFVRAE
jgi:hypothetical protein